MVPVDEASEEAAAGEAESPEDVSGPVVPPDEELSADPLLPVSSPVSAVPLSLGTSAVAVAPGAAVLEPVSGVFGLVPVYFVLLDDLVVVPGVVVVGLRYDGTMSNFGEGSCRDRAVHLGLVVVLPPAVVPAASAVFCAPSTEVVAVVSRPGTGVFFDPSGKVLQRRVQMSGGSKRGVNGSLHLLVVKVRPRTERDGPIGALCAREKSLHEVAHGSARGSAPIATLCVAYKSAVG